MKKYLACLTGSMIAVVCLWGCKKESNAGDHPAKFTGCRITNILKVEENTKYAVADSFFYNDDGTVNKIHSVCLTLSNSNSTEYFTYKTGNMLISSKPDDGGASKEMYSIDVDLQNRITAIRTSDNSSFDNTWLSYQYDSSGNMVLITNNYYNTISTQNFQWKNGDLQWSTSGTSVITYVYDTGLYNTGNIKSGMSDFMNYGRGIYTSKRLRTKAIIDNKDTINYTYVLDNGGKITNLTIREPDNFVTRYEIKYSCE